jgi:hypothetical protein
MSNWLNRVTNRVTKIGRSAVGDTSDAACTSRTIGAPPIVDGRTQWMSVSAAVNNWASSALHGAVQGASLCSCADTQ